MNTYLYANANPIKYIDPTGNVAIADDIIIGGGIIVGACIATNCIAPIADLIEDIVDKVSDAIEQCKDDGCPPCKTISGRIVPVGTIAYRPLDILPDDVIQHGVVGSHHNIFIAKQNPNNCQCFWQKQKYVLKPNELPANAIPIEPFLN